MHKPSNMGDKVFSLILVIFGIYSYLFFSIAFNALISGIGFIDENKDLYLMLSALGSIGLYSLLMFFFSHFTRNIEKKSSGEVTAVLLLILIGLGIVLQFLVYQFFFFFYGFFPPSPAELEFAKLMDDHSWYVIVAALLIAPVFEELIFRKYAFNILAKSFKVPVAVALSSFLFGAYHLTLRQFFFSSLLGLLFGIIYIRTGRIGLTILFHFSFNAFGLVVANFSNALFYILGPEMFILSLPLFVILAVFGVIIVLRELKKAAPVFGNPSAGVERKDRT